MVIRESKHYPSAGGGTYQGLWRFGVEVVPYEEMSYGVSVG